MTRTRYTFFVEDGQRQALRAIKERDGITESEQIRRAIDDWIVRKDIAPKGERKRVSARRRS